MYGDLSEKEIEHLLTYELLGHIGCHSNGVTYVVPICYAYDGNCIYGRTFEGTKIKMMREPEGMFSGEHLENMGRWQSVICWGEFEELTEPDKRNKGIEVLQNRVSAVMSDKNLRVSHHWPFSSYDSDNSNNIKGIIFCIHINEKTGRFEKN